ncbi:tRNA lysidine(34) synthetase TilS [Simkania negevensis]|uniref:tRNA(Ile)-lysidine synthase n=1 Tax=Simkania negevensis TaxID=83561 RepID=A0ABS3AVX2_9BACT|nr:tRNA lysidine(34) synthetase TilS [Simkania negevensis]
MRKTAGSKFNFLKRAIEKFLAVQWRSGAPLLVAVSGGSDSLCLFNILLSLRERLGLDLHVAHVDHGWREESGRESEALRLLAGAASLPFHCKKIDSSSLIGNLEDGCRNERLTFFAELVEAHACQAVLLAHHADDLAETVLKRLLEGASLPLLSGMEEVSQHGKLALWRPLLRVRKAELTTCLQEMGEQPFEDSTNQDPSFLRVRLRQQILPLLVQSFGKEVTEPLCRLSKASAELRCYLDEKTASYNHCVSYTPDGVVIDFSKTGLPHRVEARHLLRSIAKKQQFVLTHAILENILSHLEKGSAHKKFYIANQLCYVDRYRVTISLRLDRW